MRGFSAAASSGMATGLTGPATEAGKKAGQGYVSGFGNSVQNGGKVLSGLGDSLTLGLTVPLIGAGAGVFSASKNFNEGMANIATLIPGNVDRVAELKSGIREMSVEMGTSTDDMTEGMYNVISAFGDGEKSFDILALNAKAAKAGLASTTDAINLTSAVTKGYGDTSQEAVQKASDLALLTVRLGQTTFPELASSVGAVIPLAQTLGVTQEELFGSMAAFTGVTGSASEVATQMRGALQGLSAPTKDAAEAIEAAGFASGAAAVEELGLAGAVGLLTSAAEETGQPLQKFLSSVEAQTFALGLAGAQSEDYEKKLAAMANAQGTTEEAFTTTTTGVNEAGFAADQAAARAKDLALTLGDGLAPAVVAALEAAEPFVNKISDLATQFSEADPETQKMILGFVGILAAAGPALSIFGRLTSLVGGSVRGIAAFGRGTLIVARGAGRMALGVGRAIGMFARLGMAATRAALTVGRAFARMVLAALKAAARVIAQIAIQIARWVVLAATALASAAQVALAWLISIGPILLVGLAIAGLVALIVKNWDTIVEATKQVGQFIADIFNETVDWIGAKIDDVVGFFTGLPERVTGFIDTTFGHLSDAATGAKDWISGRVDDVVGFFTGLPGRVASSMREAFKPLRTAASSARRWVRTKVNEIVDFFKKLPGRASRAISTLADTIKSPFTTAFNAIKRLWNRTVGGFGFNVPSWVPGIGGKGFSIPKMHTGGIVPGSGDVPILAEGGEGVFTREQMAALGASSRVAPASPTDVVIRPDGLDRALLEFLRRSVRIEGGGSVQVAFGQ